MRTRRALLALLALMLLLPVGLTWTAGCGGEDKETTRKRRAPRSGAASRTRRRPRATATTNVSQLGTGDTAADYKELPAGELGQTGTIKVQVKWAEGQQMPQLKNFVTNGKDANVCCGNGPGTPLLNNRLVVDQQTRGVSEVLVYLADIKQGKAWPKLDPHIDQHHCLYSPMVTVARSGQPVKVTSSDLGITHTVKVMPYLGTDVLANMNFSGPKAKEPQSKAFDAGLYELRCEAGHNWMNAYLFASNNPYVGVTGRDGSVTLSDVPAGQYRLVVLHPDWSFLTTGGDEKTAPQHIYNPMLEHAESVTVQAGGQADIQLALSDSGFAK